MSFNNYNQQGFGVQPQQTPPQQQKRDRKLFTGRVAKAPEVKVVNTKNGEQAVLNLDIVMDISTLETGAQWARLTFWDADAYLVSAVFKQNDTITGSGIVNWREWESNGKSGKSLEYDFASVYLDANQVLDLIRGEINFALESLNKPNTPNGGQVVEQPEPQVQQQPQPQVQPQPTPTVEGEFGGPTLDVSSDELPF